MCEFKLQLKANNAQGISTDTYCLIDAAASHHELHAYYLSPQSKVEADHSAGRKHIPNHPGLARQYRN